MIVRRLCGFLVLIVLLAATTSLSGRATAITIGPGVVFQPSGSWANISFASSQTFASVRVDATGVTFDSVRFGVAKEPQALPRATLVISTWTPLQTVANASAVRFSGDAPSGTNLSFSLSGVIPAREYFLEVDGVEVSRVFSDTSGFVAFWWSDFSVHDFHVFLGWRIGTPPTPPPLSANFTFAPTSPAVGEAVSFSAAAAGGVPPYAYAWNFGDGFTAGGAAASHAYASDGPFTVNLTVTDDRGRAAYAEKSITVQAIPPPPTLSANFTFAPTSPAVGDSVAFSAAASGGTPPYDFAWAFGDGESGIGPTVTHAYAGPGTFTVTLTASDARPRDVSVTQVIVVRAPPPPPPEGNVTAAFDYTIDGWTVTFVDRSTSDRGLPIATRFWAFGDGTSSSEASPTHTYAPSGLTASYTVVLVACDGDGNCGSTSREITFTNLGLLVTVVGIPVAVVAALVLLFLLRRRRKKLDSASIDDILDMEMPP